MSASGPRTRARASRPGVLNRTAAQELTREVLWPAIRTSVLMHDSQFSFGERAGCFPDCVPSSWRPPWVRLASDGG